MYRSIGIDEIRLDRVSRFSEYDRMFKHINSQLKYLRETYPYEYGNGFLTDEVVSLPSLKIFSNGYMDYTSFNKKTNMTRTIGVRLHELSVWHIASISDLESLDYLLENVDDILKKYEDKIRPKTKEIVI